VFTSLLIVVAAGLLAPLALGFFPRVRLPAIVLEIVLGIVIGPSLLSVVISPRSGSCCSAASARKTPPPAPGRLP
jgi:Kef-type K+ transport system membrane component KefB